MSEQIKDKARQAYQDQQGQDTESGRGKPTVFVAGYVTCHDDPYARIDALEKQLSRAEECNYRMRNCFNCKHGGYGFMSVMCTHPNNPTQCDLRCLLWTEREYFKQKAEELTAPPSKGD